MRFSPHAAILFAGLLLNVWFVGASVAADSLNPPENLVISGVPPIPATLPEELRPYTEARSAGLTSWHPERREMLIATRFGNTAQIHEVRQPGGARRQLTFFSEPVNTAEHDPRAGRFFLFSRDIGGNEFAQIYRYDLADGRNTLLTDGGRTQNGGWVWSSSGKDRIVYGSTRRNGADRDLWIMNPEKPESDRLLVELSGGGWWATDWSPDDTRIAVREYLSASRSNLWLVNAVNGEKVQIAGENEHVSYEKPLFSHDGQGLFLATDKGGEFLQLAYMDLGTRALTMLTADIPWDVEDFELSPDGKWLAFIINEAGISRPYLLDVATRKYTPVGIQQGVIHDWGSGGALQKLLRDHPVEIPQGVIRGLEWHENSQEIGFSLGTARSSSDVYSVEIATGALTRWTESELGGMVATELSEPELVRWKSFDEREITGFLYRAHRKFTGPRPVIIDIHGGPEGQARPGFMGRENYFLNELGISIVTPNVRGSTGYGKSFEKLDNAMLREDSVKDIGALLDWIARQPELDASRVMVSGGSYGGYMALASAIRYADRIRCALDVVGISHFGTFLKNTESYRRALRRVEYGDETDPEMAAFFDRISPLNQATQITKPLMVVQGGNDPRVPLSEAEQIVARVREQGTPVWYVMAKDEGHGFAKKPNRDFSFYAEVLFLRTFLLAGGGEAPQRN